MRCTSQHQQPLTIVMKMPARGSSLISRPSNWKRAMSFFKASWICGPVNKMYSLACHKQLDVVMVAEWSL